MAASLYPLAATAWKHGHRRHVTSHDGTCLWLGCPTYGHRQIHLRRANEHRFVITTSGLRCWATATGQGLIVNTFPTDRPVPGHISTLLADAVPEPCPLSLYGYTRGGRVTVIYTPWDTVEPGEPDPTELHLAHFVLAGEPDADVWTLDRAGRATLDLDAWWRAVDDGTITNIDTAVATSPTPVEMRRKNGVYHTILVRAAASWTGIDGPALYTYSGTSDVTLEQALRLRGTDIRHRMHALPERKPW